LAADGISSPVLFLCTCIIETMDRSEMRAHSYAEDSISRLTRLRTLNLLRNKLTHLPNDIGNLTAIETLHISSNRIECVFIFYI
jgi:Leucine-rich repeat (LRR) protein